MSRFAPVIALLLACTPLCTQVVWSDRSSGVAGPQEVAVDTAQGRVFALGYAALRPAKMLERIGSEWVVRPELETPEIPGVAGLRLGFDVANDRLMLVARRFDPQLRDYVWETWVLQAGSWALLPAATPILGDHSIVQDPVRRRVLVYGAVRNYSSPGPTRLWQFDGSAWAPIQYSTQPFDFYGASMTYDSGRDVFVLIGRSASGTECWELSPNGWTRRLSLSVPAPRIFASIAYDPIRQITVLFGGRNASGDPLGDTWEWDGVDWRQIAGVGPSPRSGGGMWFDLRGLGIVLFGGGSPSLYMGDTWLYSNAWTRLSGHAWPLMGNTPGGVALDSARGRVVHVGSAGDGNTWEWDGYRWHHFETPNSPYAARTIQMVFDSARRRTVAIVPGFVPGNRTYEWDGVAWVVTVPVPFTAGAYFPAAFDDARRRIVSFAYATTDTWEYDGSAWIANQTAHWPTTRDGSALAFDPILDKLLCFDFGETWVYDGVDWARLNPAVSPSPRSRHAMTTDWARRRVLLFGGASYLDDLWEWTGTTWRRLSTAGGPTPPGRWAHKMTPDVDGEGILLFDGYGDGRSLLGDMWSMETEVAARLEPYGSGCPGSAGVPRLTAIDERRPWLGEYFSLAVDSVPPCSPAVLLLGLSDEYWGNTPLPLLLAGAGAPGCALWCALDTALLMAPASGSANWEIVICNCASGVGRQFFVQAAVIDPAANALGVVFSGALAGTLGRL